jgi:uncharacterized protein YggE
MVRQSLCVAVVLFCLSGARHVAAQYTESGVVSGTGAVAISRPSEVMRMQIALLAKGGTLKDAMASLKARSDAARTRLVELGAVKDSITIGPAQISEQRNDRNRQIEMMMASRLKRGGKSAAKSKVTPPVIVSAQLTAEWRLTGKTGDELLLAVHPLQEKIKGADIGGTKEAEKLSPEQEELLEEAESSGFNFSSGDEPKPGEPTFLFVARISDDERDKATAQAYEKARLQAARLAKAAGAELGALRTLQNAGFSGGDEYDFGWSSYSSSSYAYRAMQLARSRQSTDEDDDTEAVGVAPGEIKYKVTIMASFDIKPGK